VYAKGVDMRMTGTFFSIRFFTGILISAGILPVLLAIYNQVSFTDEYLVRSSFIMVLGLLALSWLVILRNARRSQQALIETNQQLLARTKELEELNHHLEDKIQQRTRNLLTLQTQLVHAEKFSAIGQLAAGVAHEINNPIGFINSNLQTLQQYVIHYTRLLGILNKLEKALKDKDQQRASEVVASWEKIRKETNFAFMGGDIDSLLKESMEGAEKIGKIVSDLRTLASPDHGMVDSVNIEALIESMLNIVHNEIKYKAEVKKEYSHLPFIVCNPQKIGQVLVNLLTNAAQAIESKGTITIKTYSVDDHVCIDITDTGHGISPEHSTKIFDPLFTTKSPGTGLGLGLSLSYDIVRKHKGVIKFHSKLGEGTTFTVMLPLMPPVYEASFIWRDYERD
jgi:two-component system, NtrC family, sensor kinase